MLLRSNRHGDIKPGATPGFVMSLPCARSPPRPLWIA